MAGKADFEIRFKTSHENTGGDKAEQQLNKTRSAADKLRAGVKGLALEFPVLARVIGFVTSPVTVFTAAVGMAASAVLKWARNIKELSKRQSELEALRHTALSLKTILKEMEQTTLSKVFKEIGEEAKNAATEAGKLNAALEVALQRGDELEDLGLEAEKQRIKTEVAKGKMSEKEGRHAMAQLENQADERKAQREFRNLQLRLKNQQDALRDTEPQLARLAFTPPEDLARMKAHSAAQDQRAEDAKTALTTEGPKLREEILDAEAALQVFRGGGGVAVTDWMKFGVRGGETRPEMERKITDFIEGKQREFDSLVRAQDFEQSRAQKLKGRVTSAEGQNEQIELIRGTQAELRTGIRDTEQEISNRVQFNRRALQLRRTTRESAVEEQDVIEQKELREKQRKDEERRMRGGRGRRSDDGSDDGAALDGASLGGGGGGEFLGSKARATSRDGNRQIAVQLEGAFAEIAEGQREILDAIARGRRDVANVKAYAKDLREMG